MAGGISQALAEPRLSSQKWFHLPIPSLTRLKIMMFVELNNPFLQVKALSIGFIILPFYWTIVFLLILSTIRINIGI